MKDSGRVTLLSLLLLGATVFLPCSAEEGEDAVDFKMEDVKIDKAQVSQMIEMMKAQGQITAEEAGQAQQELNQKSDGEMQALQATAIQRIESGNIPKLPQRAPASVPAPVEAKVEVKDPAPVPAAPVSASVPAPAAQQVPAAKQNQSIQEAFNFINNK